MSSSSRARSLLSFHARAKSSGLRGVLFSQPGRMTRSLGLVIEVRKSAVVCCFGHKKPSSSKYDWALDAFPKKICRPLYKTRTFSKSYLNVSIDLKWNCSPYPHVIGILRGLVDSDTR